jgi:hypothetical protein
MNTVNNLNLFKETLLRILISYFGKNLILLNNVIELSDGIVMSIDDLSTLVAIITDQPKDKVQIIVKEIEIQNCCLKIASTCLAETLPLYRQIEMILVKYNRFDLKYPEAYEVMKKTFNICLNYVLLKDDIPGLVIDIQGVQK